MKSFNPIGSRFLYQYGGILLFLFFITSSCNSSKNNQKKLSEYRQLRLEKLNQPRSLIHNNDGGDSYVYPVKFNNFIPGTENQPRPSRDTIELDYEFSIPNFLNIRTAGLKGSDVSTISYCTLSSSFGQFTHNTKVGEFLTLTHERPGRKNIVPELVKLGTDPLQLTIEFARENNFEIFWSNRINDTHDAGHRPDQPYERWSKLKTEHPEFLFGQTGESLPHGRWSAVDFSHQEIRDLCVQYYTEVCENYDVDGVELDFFRHLFLFSNVARGETATAEQLDMLTDMVRQIREMTERVGMKKGKPILVLARVPDSFEYCRQVGIDLEKWVSQGFIDIVVGSGYFRLNAWDYLLDYCTQYGVKYYAGLSEPRIRDEHPSLQRLQNAVYRARAAAAWQLGVDGLYVFNEYNTRSQYLREIGSADKLTGKNNLYFVTYRNGNPNSYLKNGAEYASLPLLSPVNQVPVTSEPLEFMIEIGNESKASDVFLILYARNVNPQNLSITINNTQASFKKSTENGLIIFEVPNSAIQPGKNNLIVNNLNKKEVGENKPVLLDAAILFYRNENDTEIKHLADLCR